MLGIILLLIMLQDFLPEAHPTIPTLGAYDILHPTYDYLIFFLTQNNRCFSRKSYRSLMGALVRICLSSF